MYQRLLNLDNLLKKKSFFLFGPRSTGKSTLIEAQLGDARIYDLLDAEVFRALVKRPKLLEEESAQDDKIIVIDEIQKYPELLDEVHRLIQKKKKTFLLTGSSARKVKHGAANLLAGRAWQAELFPLTSREIPNFDLLNYLNHGGLPHVYNSPHANEELVSYVSTYLKEEIQAEALTRNIAAFAEFLDIMALSNGQEINFERLASDCQVSTSTLKNYVEILSDTLLSFVLKAFTKTKKRKAITRAKHYFFDIGVVNTLANRSEIKAKSELFGAAFEHFIILEVRAYLSYNRIRKDMTYWRSTSQFEVDLIISNEFAIEIKSSHLVSDHDLKGLRALKEESFKMVSLVVSLDSTLRQTTDGIQIMPWQMFLTELWAGRLF